MTPDERAHVEKLDAALGAAIVYRTGRLHQVRQWIDAAVLTPEAEELLCAELDAMRRAELEAISRIYGMTGELPTCMTTNASAAGQK